MEQNQMEKLLFEGKYEELIGELEGAEYEEYSMLTLCRAYLYIGDEKKAKKLIRKLKMLFPAGELMAEEERLYDAIESGKIEEYLRSLSTFGCTKPEKWRREESQPIQSQNLVTVLAPNNKNTKTERVIPRTIKECFDNVIGLENVQVELDKFYKLLCFQNDRKENEFLADLFKSTHFVIAGARGSGKTLLGGIIAELLYNFGFRDNREPENIDAREIKKAYEGDIEKGIDNLFGQYSGVTVIVENIQVWFDDDQNIRIRDMLLSLERTLRNTKEELSIVLTGTCEAVRKACVLNETLEDTFFEIIEIAPYSTMELFEIAKKIAKNKQLLLNNVEKVIIKKIDNEKTSTEFMNGITVERYLDEAVKRMAYRYCNQKLNSDKDRVYLMPEDFEIELEEESLEQLIALIDSLTGLQSVKTQIRKRIQAVQAETMAQQLGSERKGGHGSLHMVFLGNPGTGKTTVARLIGKIYQQLGVLPRGNCLVECTRSDLVGEYMGETAKLVQGKVKEAIGGVLFIDEAYALCRDERDCYGHEAVDELIAAIENNKNNMLVILAGYKKEMEQFLKSNLGFSSRIRNMIEFEDYTVEEMAEIFRFMVYEKNMKLEDGANDAVYQMLDVKSRVPDFGNARGVRNLFDEVMEIMNERIFTGGEIASKDEFDVIRKEDIQAVIGRKAEGEKTLDELLAELNGLTGLQSVKDKVQEMVNDIMVKECMKEHSLEVDSDHGTLHLVFKGNAGTGKTTVARLIGKIYKKLGVLKKDVFVECGRKDLVANYSGQTATQVVKKMDEADGGILFIDEAYTLNGGERDEFGKEAINTLVAELENRRDRLMVIVAGYADEMEQFLEVNQGLASRLSNEIVFEDYTMDELLAIFKYMVKQKGLFMPNDVDEQIIEMIQEQKGKQKDFGNARGVRNLLERIEKKKNSRIAQMIRNSQVIDENIIRTMEKEDFE